VQQYLCALAKLLCSEKLLCSLCVRCKDVAADSRTAPKGRRPDCISGFSQLVLVVVRTMHVLIVTVFVRHIDVVQTVMAMRRLVRMLMHVEVLMLMGMTVGMLVGHVPMAVRMAMGVRVGMGVPMLVRMAVGMVMAMAMFLFAIRHLVLLRFGHDGPWRHDWADAGSVSTRI